ncbi:MAG TPA: glycosyltransferase family 1 protein [Myxococcota bacterium]|nr:glycosyltransferase family 1 protein [Myxococcota bacterium]
MRIALFTEVFLPKIDGITNRLANTIRCLRARGHEVLVFAPSGSVPSHAGARVVRAPSLPFPGYPGLRLGLVDPRWLLELALFRADVVHAVGPAVLGVWGVTAARALGLPLVASYHTDLPRYLPSYGLGRAEGLVWSLIRRVHGAAHVNLCPSRFTANELAEHGIPDVGLWRGGVDTDLFHPGRRSLETRARLSGGNLGGPLAVYVGRLAREKNLERLGEILDAVPDASLALVGDGPDRERLEAVFRGRPVVFTGFLSGKALAEAYASGDVFAMPSETETLGFVVLEAMSSGVPVVAADAGGVRQLVRHDETGLLFDPAAPGALGKTVAELLASRDRQRFLAERARKHAEQSSWDDETRKLVGAYRAAIERAGR